MHKRKKPETYLKGFENVIFQPQNFGGYTSAMIFCGLFLGYTTSKSWWFIVASGIMFFIAMYFYSLDNKN